MPNVIVYDMAHILLWEKEAPTLRQLITTKTAEIATHHSELVPLQAQLHLLEAQITELESQIKLQPLTGASQSSKYVELFDLDAKAHPETVIADPRQGELEKLQAQRTALRSKMLPHENGIAAGKVEVRAANERLSWIGINIPAAKQFLEALNHRPTELIDALHREISTSFGKYASDHPAGCSLQVRMCLYNIDAKLKALTLEGDRQVQLTYLRSSAFLWDMYHHVAHEGVDAEFKDLLIKLIGSTHIAENGDLPDALATRQTAAFHWEMAKGANSNLLVLSEHSFLNLEQITFGQAVNQASLQATNCIHPLLRSKIFNAIYLIEVEIRNKQRTNKPVDFYFYTRAITDLGNIAANPQNLDAGRRLAQLTEVASGTPSVGRQVAGALMMVAGLALITASILGFALTFGSSTFLSAAGILLGLSALHTQFALTVSSTVFLEVGARMTFFGKQKHSQGLRHGLSQEIEDISSSVLNPHSTSLSDPASHEGTNNTVYEAFALLK